METTARLAGETPQEREVTDFFMTHHALIERLVRDRQQLLNRLAMSVRSIHDAVQTMPETAVNLHGRFIFQTYTVASHCTIQGATIGLDLTAELDAEKPGWKATLFQLPNRTALVDQLRQSAAFESLHPASVVENDRHVLQRWDLHATTIQLQDGLVAWTNALAQAASSFADQSTPASP